MILEKKRLFKDTGSGFPDPYVKVSTAEVKPEPIVKNTASAPLTIPGPVIIGSSTATPLMLLGGLAGMVGGIYYAHKRGSGLWGIVGYAFLFNILGSFTGQVIGKAIPALK